MDYSRTDLAERLAADYVSGTLRGGARRRLEALLPAHPVLRAAVHRWQARLVPLTAILPPVAPRPEVWQGISRRLGFAPPVSSAAPLRWWQQLSVWRGVSAFATVAALALSAQLLTPVPVQPPLVVVLNPATPAADGLVRASFVASISGDGRAVVTKPLMQVSLQADRALELWAVPAEGAPRSLGLIASDTATVQKGRVPVGTAALAVSLEPAGGSTTGAPTGPVLYVGKLNS